MARAVGPTCAYFATDINEESAKATLETFKLHGIDSRVDILRTDLVDGMLPELAGKVDLLLFNPPYVVTPDEEVASLGIEAAWAGGKDGRVVIDKALPVIASLMAENGHAYMVVIPENDPDDIIQHLNPHGLHGTVIAKKSADEELLMVMHLSRS